MCLTSVVSDATDPSRKLCILLLDLWYASTFLTAELEQAARGMGGASSLARAHSLSFSLFLFSLSSHFFQIGYFSFPNSPSWKNLLDASSYCVHRPIPVLFFPLISGKKYRQTSFLDVLYSRFGSCVWCVLALFVDLSWGCVSLTSDLKVVHHRPRSTLCPYCVDSTTIKKRNDPILNQLLLCLLC